MGVYIHSVGVGVPARRLAIADINAAWNRKGGHGHVAVCADDEDALTLAWTAADAAIRASEIDPASIDGLWWGTTRPPFGEGPSHSMLAASLRLRPSAFGALTSGSTHCGIDALFAAADAVASGSARTAIVVVSDALRPGVGTTLEARCGAGATAFVLRNDAGPAMLGARVTHAQPLLDRYRGDTELDTRDLYDGRLFREAIFLPIVGEVAGALATASPTAWSLPDPDGRLATAVAKSAGIALDSLSSPHIYSTIGDTGAAASMLGAIDALTHRGTVAILAYGGGRASGVTIEVTRSVAGAEQAAADVRGKGSSVSYADVLRTRRQLTASGETIAMGVPPESALFARGANEMLQLLGARCADCATINTPPSIHPHCIACGGPKMEPVELARDGVVHTYVVNYTMPAPFVAPLPIAVIDLDDGSRVMLQVADDGSNVEIGMRMKLVLRRYSYERGAPVYGFKGVPVGKESA